MHLVAMPQSLLQAALELSPAVQAGTAMVAMAMAMAMVTEEAGVAVGVAAPLLPISQRCNSRVMVTM